MYVGRPPACTRMTNEAGSVVALSLLGVWCARGKEDRAEDRRRKVTQEKANGACARALGGCVEGRGRFGGP